MKKIITLVAVILVLVSCQTKNPVKDLWTGVKLRKFTGEFAPTINRHGAGLYRRY